jgi:hypothetical protein
MSDNKPVSLRRSLAQHMRYPRYRIEESGLYWIIAKLKDAEGRPVNKFMPFRPFPHQQVLNERIYDNGSRRILVPKARRMGFSTDINMCQLDSCLNNLDFHSRIVDMSEDDAKDKLVNRVTRAWDKIESEIDTGMTVGTRSGKELAFSNGSRFTASISGRGGDAAHFLHVSELGPIDYKDPKRSNEVINGAFPAADGGIIVVESTAKGPQGNFKRLCDMAMSIPADERTVDDWEVLFFAWWMDPRHVQNGSMSRIKKDTHDYLDYIQQEADIEISMPQRLWYQVTSDTVSEMKYEYPSLLQECWESPIEGAIYANDINKARAQGRIGKYHAIPRHPVFTIWDLGAPQNTRCILFQCIQGEIRIVDAIHGGHENATGTEGPHKPFEWAAALHERKFIYGKHILPHDGDTTQYTGTTFRDELMASGLRNIDWMQRQTRRDPWARINPTWGNFDRFTFNTDSPGVEIFLNHLSCYHTKTESDGITVKEVPHHDWASHYAEAFSAIIEAEERGFCSKHYGLVAEKRSGPSRKKATYKQHRLYA